MLNPEYYLGAFQLPGGAWRTTQFSDTPPAELDAAHDTRVWERRPLYCTRPPSESAWAEARWTGLPPEPQTPSEPGRGWAGGWAGRILAGTLRDGCGRARRAMLDAQQYTAAGRRRLAGSSLPSLSLRPLAARPAPAPPPPNPGAAERMTKRGRQESEEPLTIDRAAAAAAAAEAACTAVQRQRDQNGGAGAAVAATKQPKVAPLAAAGEQQQRDQVGGGQEGQQAQQEQQQLPGPTCEPGDCILYVSSWV
jgi:hypothetical protein